MKSVRRLAWLLLGLCLATTLSAREMLVLEADTPAQHPERYTYLSFDPGRTKTIDDILAQDEDQWQLNHRDFIHLGFSTDNIWARISLKVGDPDEPVWIINLADPLKDEIDLYIVSDGKVQETFHARANQSFDMRVSPHRHFLFPVNLSQYQEADIYIRMNFRQHIILPLEIMPRSEFLKMDQQSSFVIALCTGALLVMSVYNLFIFLSTRNLSYLFYVGTVLNAGMYFICMNGYGFQYLWPNAPDWNNAAPLVFGSGVAIFGNLFTFHFLGLRRHTLSHYWMVALLVGSSTGMIAAFLGEYVLSNTINSITGLICWITFASLGLKSCWEGNRYAIYFSIAWLLPFISWTLLNLGFIGIVPLSLNLLYVSYGAFIVQTILNSLALVERIKVIEAEKQQVLADNRAKMNFLAKMSHELRTPMNGILGMAELLTGEVKDPRARNYAEVIKSSASTLLTIINDILDYSKIEAGKMALENIPFDLREVIDHCLNIQSIQSRNKNIVLYADIAPDIPASVYGDPTRIGQILLNLTSNAAKFTEQGHVGIRVVYEDAEQNLIQISVEDSGVGIEPSEQLGLFDAFHQTSASVNRTHGGTGLGLNITRQLAELMGGHISVSSTPGKGSTFNVTLNLTSAAPAPTKIDVIPRPVVLLIEENKQLGSVIHQQNKIWPFDIAWVNSVDEALMYLQSNAQFRPDLICFNRESALSYQTTMETIQSLVPLKTEFLALEDTTHAGVVSRRKTALDFISVRKPLCIQDYPRLFIKAMNNDLSTTKILSPEVPATEPAGNRLNVLVVEDNAVNQMVIKGLLNKLHHKATITENGQEAVKVFTAQQDEFDIILMDCEMPVMDGFTATRHIRQWEEDNHCEPIPIVALTAHILPEQQQSCFDAGMDELLTKPVEIERLKSTLNRNTDRFQRLRSIRV
ncbi:MAG: response regulator [Pseudomonadales bacterium]|nr:response regulator [Pseudomonadales bacterium]